MKRTLAAGGGRPDETDVSRGRVLRPPEARASGAPTATHLGPASEAPGPGAGQDSPPAPSDPAGVGAGQDGGIPDDLMPQGWEGPSHEIGRCPVCGAMALTGHVWSSTDGLRQVICQGPRSTCSVRGPARRTVEGAVSGWRAMTGGPLTTVDELLAEAERVREGTVAYGRRAPGSRLGVLGKLMDVVVEELHTRRRGGWQ